MFDLEEAISEWHRQMQSAGIRSPEPLEELEIHLREDVERGKRAGLTAQAAFEMAAQRMGQVDGLKAEFEKAGRFRQCCAVNHNRIYVTALVAFLIALLSLNLVRAPGFDSRALAVYFQSGGARNVGGGLMGMYSVFTGGGFEKMHACYSVGNTLILPLFFRPWATAFCLFYSVAIGLVLGSRLLRPKSGRRLTRLLNLALLPAFPIGTALGIYGLISVDRQRTQYI